MARAQSRATAGAAAFAQSCFSRGMKECSPLHKGKSLLQLITRIIRKTPARDTTRSLFWKDPSLRATASSSPSLIPEVVFPPGGSRLLQKGFWCRLHHFGPPWERSSTCQSPRATPSRAAMPLQSPTREQSTPKCPRSRVRALPHPPAARGQGRGSALRPPQGVLRHPHPGAGEKKQILGAATPANARHASKLSAHGQEEQRHPESAPTRTHCLHLSKPRSLQIGSAVLVLASVRAGRQ